jgi:hypothetical protein
VRKSWDSGVALATSLLILLLISTMIVGLCWLVLTDQKLGGNMSDRQQAFYGAEAGMEKLTADIGNLFITDYAPSGKQVNALTAVTKQPTIDKIQYLAPDGTSGYMIGFPADNLGDPLAQNATIHSGPYQGLIAMLTPYTLTVVARTPGNSEVKLQRKVETVAIPVFQFGIFSQVDLSFFAGPDFAFGGRTHTNGNLWLAEGNGKTLTMSDKVTAVGEIIRTNLSNGWATSSNYNGTVNILNVANGTTYSALTQAQGSVSGSSVVGNISTTFNEPTWHHVSLTTYNGMLRNVRTGAVPLTLTVATPALGGTQVDLIRRPVQKEDTTSPGKLAERYYAEASLRILLSDNPQDIMKLPCIDASQPPVDLRTLAVDPLSPAGYTAFPAWYTGGIPLPTSNAANNGVYSASDGYWIQKHQPIITGYIKIDAQTSYGVPCGTWKDVTQEILNLGFAARNENPVNSLSPLWQGAPPALPKWPVAQIAPANCPDPSPNAIIRLERVRDNPSDYVTNGGCGVDAAKPPTIVPPLATDYWPLVLFDPREGNYRDTCPNGSSPCNAHPTLGGTMHFVQLDMGNLQRWFTGAIGVSGPSTKDPDTAPNDFVVYFSDRRTNFIAAPVAGGWPPASPSGNETGEYGAYDLVNPLSTSGCPNNVLDTGEDIDGLGGAVPFNYGQAPVFPANLINNISVLNGTPVLTANANCAVAAPSVVWPMTYFAQAQDARENPPLLFRRALKISNGATINLGACPSGNPCGLSIVAENPVYVHGNFNAPGGAFVAPSNAAVAIISDAITLLSNNWNNINSFISPYTFNARAATTTSYRFAAVTGKGLEFPQPSAKLFATNQDFGTDGGVHNFLRYIENWGGQTINYRGSLVSFYYNHQAVGVYKCCTTVYSPPTRAYNFDTDFLKPELLPPRTPMFRAVNTIGFTEFILPNQ